MEDYLLPCLSKQFLGIDCLGCGIQRALILLIQGKFEEAFYMYPAIYSLFPLVFVFGLHLFDKSKNYKFLLNLLFLLNLSIMIASYIWKHFI
ncbi:MAG: DUF2752 domain-containing protein [Flavobacterium sp.]|nr:DUF2752 domain-containing protein [Flavobacterium sp.]